MISPDPTLYRQYLKTAYPGASSALWERVDTILAATNWEQPNSSTDWNNCAVIALITAAQTDDIEERFIWVQMAFEAFTQGGDDPLCLAHLTLISVITGQTEEARQVAFSSLIANLQTAYNTAAPLPTGLVYLPVGLHTTSNHHLEILPHLLLAENGYQQALLLLSEVVCRSCLVFYSPIGERSLAISHHLAPQSFQIQLKLGIAHLLNGRAEGVLYLQQVRHLAPQLAPVLQSLYLAYRDLGNGELAHFWWETARQTAPASDQPAWHWSHLPVNSPFTYIPFDTDLLLAVEASLNSIVTSVLLADGDWFEQEMEFWRNQTQPGMGVIDVGANVGVYTFSAARRVGATGRVLAVEPFSGCVRQLTETCRFNDLPWVTVCHGAASDRNGTVRLAIEAASELNQIVSEDELPPSGNVETVPCFALDTLIELENMQTVDILKIDAEGHELQVLSGSERILTEFRPIILYENIAREGLNNLPVASFLQTKGYQLFRYLPFIRQLEPINAIEELQGSLNIIAMHQDTV